MLKFFGRIALTVIVGLSIGYAVRDLPDRFFAGFLVGWGMMLFKQVIDLIEIRNYLKKKI